MKRLLLAAALVLAAGCGAAPGAHRPRPACRPLSIVSVTAGRRAVETVTVCGMVRRGDWACWVTPPGPLRPGARLACRKL